MRRGLFSARTGREAGTAATITVADRRVEDREKTEALDAVEVYGENSRS